MAGFRSRIHPAPLLAAMTLACFTILAFYPGGMTPDSLAQFQQANTQAYGDLHPPIMAAFWRLLLLLWPHAGGLFLVHTFAYWSLWWLLATYAFKDYRKQLLVLGIACLPSLWCQLGVLWKDTELSITLLGCYLFVLFAGLASRAGRPRLFWLSVGTALVFFIYSSTVRENSFPALLPLAYLAVRTCLPRLQRLRGALSALALCVGGLIAAHIIDYGILHAYRNHIFQQIQSFDIAGVFSQNRDPKVLPDYWKELNPGLTADDLVRHYDPTGAVPLFYWWDPPLRETTDPGNLKALTGKWLWTMAHFPREYLRHRWAVFRTLLQIGNSAVYIPYYFKIDPNDWGLHFSGDMAVRTIVILFITLFRNTLFFRGWAYLLILVVLLGLQWRRFTLKELMDDPACCAALSGLLYLLPFSVFAPGADFRYLYPTVTLTFLSILLALPGSGDQIGPTQKH